MQIERITKDFKRAMEHSVSEKYMIIDKAIPIIVTYDDHDLPTDILRLSREQDGQWGWRSDRGLAVDMMRNSDEVSKSEFDKYTARFKCIRDEPPSVDCEHDF